MRTSVTTIERYILDQERNFPHATGELSNLLYDIALATKIIAAAIRRAGLVDVLGSAQNRNVQGEDQQKLDIHANEALKNAMKHTGRVCVMASEEDEEIIGIPPEYPAGKYAVLFDPLDGSSNIDVNAPVGTIFSIYRRVSLEGRGTVADVLQTGNRQVAAGYVIYGSSTMLVYTTGQGVHGFTLDPTIGEFLLSHPDIVTPPVGKYYSVNESHFARWDKGTQMAVRGFHGDLPELIKGKKKMSIPTEEICEKDGARMVIKFGRFGQFLACENYPECQNTREVGSKKTADANGANGEEVEEIPVCELCGREMALKKGRFGSFYGCTGYPECKNIRKIAKGDQKPAAPPVPLDEICPKDGAHLVRRQGRFGEFISCSNYPKCDYVKRETLGIKCPKCKDGEIVVKKSRRGKAFYGCSNYPKCDEVYWDKPTDQACPQCGAPHLLEKTTKRDGTVRYCKNEDCDYKMTVETTEVKSDSKAGTESPAA